MKKVLILLVVALILTQEAVRCTEEAETLTRERKNGGKGKGKGRGKGDREDSGNSGEGDWNGGDWNGGDNGTCVKKYKHCNDCTLLKIPDVHYVWGYATKCLKPECFVLKIKLKFHGNSATEVNDGLDKQTDDVLKELNALEFEDGEVDPEGNVIEAVDEEEEQAIDTQLAERNIIGGILPKVKFVGSNIIRVRVCTKNFRLLRKLLYIVHGLDKLIPELKIKSTHLDITNKTRQRIAKKLIKKAISNAFDKATLVTASLGQIIKGVKNFKYGYQNYGEKINVYRREHQTRLALLEGKQETSPIQSSELALDVELRGFPRIWLDIDFLFPGCIRLEFWVKVGYIVANQW